MTTEQRLNHDKAAAEKPVRVLIVDDVKSARDLLSDILATDPRFQVLGTVADGLEAVERALELRPDLITMDIRLPGLDGFLAVERILAEFPVPIIMITASLGDQKERLFRAFKAGALDVVEKQELYLWRTRPEIRSSFLRRLHILAQTRVGQRLDSAPREPAPLHGLDVPDQWTADELPHVVAIAASTGGPSALMTLFKQIPAQIHASFLVVQHMSRGFLDGLVRWLDNEVALSVRKAQEGELLEPGSVLFAPEDYHLMVSENGSIRLNKSLPIAGHRPSAEILFKSVAISFGKRAMGIILTGMGSDGAEGLKKLRERGGHTIAQDEATSIIFGMPRAAIEEDAAELVLPLDEVALQITAWISGRQGRGPSIQ